MNPGILFRAKFRIFWKKSKSCRTLDNGSAVQYLVVFPDVICHAHHTMGQQEMA